jgi:hypothetical protein
VKFDDRRLFDTIWEWCFLMATAGPSLLFLQLFRLGSNYVVIPCAVMFRMSLLISLLHRAFVYHGSVVPSKNNMHNFVTISSLAFVTARILTSFNVLSGLSYFVLIIFQVLFDVLSVLVLGALCWRLYHDRNFLSRNMTSDECVFFNYMITSVVCQSLLVSLELAYFNTTWSSRGVVYFHLQEIIVWFAFSTLFLLNVNKSVAPVSIYLVVCVCWLILFFTFSAFSSLPLIIIGYGCSYHWP